MFGNPETTTGGQALKFYSSIRLDSRKTGNIQDGDKVIGSRHRVKVVKNKTAPPFRVAEFDIMNVGGISKSGGLIDVALELGVVERSGAFFRYKGQVLGQGREAVKLALDDDSKLANEIEAGIHKIVKEGKEVPKEVGEKKED